MPHVDTPQSVCLLGVARCDVTPPVGIYHRMWGAATHDRATGVHRPLTATALVFRPAHPAAGDLPDVEQGIGELARVLTADGTLVAASVGVGNMEELWDMLGDSSTRDLSFGPDNGAELLSRRFRHVERHDALGTAVFPDASAVRRFVAMTITRAHLADRVPDFEGEFRTRSAHVVFEAREPR